MALRDVGKSAFLALLFAMGALAPLSLAIAKEPGRIALVIGNEAYPSAPVANAAADAKAIADILRQGGFDVVYEANAGKADLTRAAETFAGKLERGAIAVVYFSGHAVQYQSRNFLIPVDAAISSEAGVRTEALDMDVILDPLIVARSPGSVIILDASRKNQWQRLFSRSARGLAYQEALSGISIIYPTAPGKVAEGNAFTSELVNSLKVPGLGFDAVINRTRSALRRAGAKDQTVWESSPAPKDLVILTQGRPPAKIGDAVELGFWETIKNSEIPADFQAYIDSYPSGQFVSLAQGRLAQLAPDKGQRTRAAALEHGVLNAPPAAPFRDCPVCPEFVAIPPGSFDMGATDGFAFERPVHRVSIQKPFYIGRRKITFDEWDACVNEGGCQHRPGDRGLGRGLRPVTDIDWNDAKSYLRWLSGKTGHAYRLPTEAEWEYAARAGTKTAYAWGATLEKDRANCIGCTTSPLNKTVETGTFPPNGFGLFDMAGNAAEWVEDCWNESYRGAPADGSAWTKPGCRERVLRGGSFNNDARFVRSSARFKYDHDVRYYANGFRIVRE
jgi:formylglycine-generating enzyme required for sulfatase activity